MAGIWRVGAEFFQSFLGWGAGFVNGMGSLVNERLLNARESAEKRDYLAGNLF
jgi:hypothetical protein